MKTYLLFAGVNGAGKSTLYQTLESNVMNMPRVNTDEIVKTFGDWRNLGDVIKAGKIAIQQIENNFSSGISFNQETTLCGASIMKNILRAKELGYTVIVHYVGVESATIAKERVRKRVENGGHGIPDRDVDRRYIESFQKLKDIIPICDQVILYDNTWTFNRIAVYEKGTMSLEAPPLPNWYLELKRQFGWEPQDV